MRGGTSGQKHQRELRQWRPTLQFGFNLKTHWQFFALSDPISKSYKRPVLIRPKYNLFNQIPQATQTRARFVSPTTKPNAQRPFSPFFSLSPLPSRLPLYNSHPRHHAPQPLPILLASLPPKPLLHLLRRQQAHTGPGYDGAA